MDTTTFDPKLVIGPLLPGVIVAAILFGCATIQVCIYFSMFRKDFYTFKLLVAIVFTVLFVHMSCLSANLCLAVIAAYSNTKELQAFPISTNLEVVISALVSFLVRGFFIYRLWKISYFKFLVFMCASLALLALACVLTAFGIIYARSSNDIAQYLNLIHTQELSVTASLVTAVACDMATSASLIWRLKTESRSVLGRTSRSVDRLIVWTIETGVVTSLQSIAELVCFWTMPQNYIWLGLYMFLPSVFTNALLAALNGRLLLRDYGPTVVEFGSGEGAARSEPIVFNITRVAVTSSELEGESSKEDQICPCLTGPHCRDRL
ncbi:hypothetical protein BV22DRAFT_763076 [Leucogyrophana mollusca]|uniref:Uncharacterized protein n=1 Tax=Leucogyrophana mollusca TaxID=85980 RepID=A0ACB8B5D7_9AGAM|nr:hypothetical protein BV22DRAFT_763076 [Leucogyrophana mollusca]